MTLKFFSLLTSFALGFCSVFFIVKYCLDMSGWDSLVIIFAQYLVPVMFGILIAFANYSGFRR